jgi:vancomycin resistance protein VanW
MKPIQRSALRLKCGKAYYTLKRYMEWLLEFKRFARTIRENHLAYSIFQHRTPLLRKLKDVDMWLQHNKIINLKLAVEKLNGVMLLPGETFSYWRLIGKPTRKKGYVDGMVLYFGSFRPDVGGGLCQLSNLIYWMTLHSPLTVVERHRHSYDVFPDAGRTQPFGSGATCAYNYLDLQIRNDTDQPYQLQVTVGDSDLIGEWRSEIKSRYRYEIYEKEHLIKSEYWGGYTRHNLIYRRIWNEDGLCISDEQVAENHALMMYEPLLKEVCDS